MERKSKLLTFIAALIPGVGYIYYGLVKKGVEAFIIFSLISPVFNILDMRWLGDIIKIPLWCYLFIDTFNIAERYNRGEILQDSGFVIKDDKPLSSDILNSINSKIPSNKWNLIAVVFICIGIIAILNQVLDRNIYYMIKAAIRNFLVPGILIIAGLYMLFKSKKTEKKL